MPASSDLALIIPRHIREHGVAREGKATYLAVLVLVIAEDHADRILVGEDGDVTLKRAGGERLGVKGVGAAKLLTGGQKAKEAVVHVLHLGDAGLGDEILRGDAADLRRARLGGKTAVHVPFHEPYTASVDVGITLVKVVHRLEGEHIAQGSAQPLDALGVAVALFAVIGGVHLRGWNFGGDLALDHLVGDISHHCGVFGRAVDGRVAEILPHMLFQSGDRPLVLRSCIFVESTEAVETLFCLFVH